jgi:hypothetical protein
VPTNQTEVVNSPEPAKSSEQSTRNPAPKASPDTGQAVVPNPYCPAPNFSLTATRQSTSNYNLLITATPASGDPSLKPECGGGIRFDWPIVTYPANGSLCDGSIYPISNNTWGVSCSIYGGASYGPYTFSFTVTGTNGYAKSTTKTASHTINYVQE